MIMYGLNNDITVMFKEQYSLSFAIDLRRHDFATPFYLEGDSFDYVFDKMKKLKWNPLFSKAIIESVFRDDEVIQNG